MGIQKEHSNTKNYKTPRKNNITKSNMRPTKISGSKTRLEHTNTDEGEENHLK